jgi:ankyrin repeat protein
VSEYFRNLILVVFPSLKPDTDTLGFKCSEKIQPGDAAFKKKMTTGFMKQFRLTILISFCLILLANNIEAQEDSQVKKLILAMEAKDSINVIVSAQELTSVSYTDSNNSSLLMIASRYGFTKVCDILIGKGANLDLQDKFGNTALIYATYFGNIEVVNLLISKGANLDLRNKNNENAFIIAKLNKNDKIAYSLQGNQEKEISPQNTVVAQTKGKPEVAQDTYNYQKDNSKHKEGGVVLRTVSYIVAGSSLAFYGAAWIIGENGGEEPTEESASKSKKAYEIGNLFLLSGTTGLLISLFIKPKSPKTIGDYYKSPPKMYLDKAFVYGNSYSLGVGLKFRF